MYGVTFDPFDDTRLATYSDDADGIVKVWDVRKLKDSEPLVSLAAGDEQGAGAPPPARGSSGARGGKALAQAGWRPLTTPNPTPKQPPTPPLAKPHPNPDLSLDVHPSQVGWCATRRGVLGTVGEGSASLCLWDVEAGVRAQHPALALVLARARVRARARPPPRSVGLNLTRPSPSPSP